MIFSIHAYPRCVRVFIVYAVAGMLSIALTPSAYDTNGPDSRGFIQTTSVQHAPKVCSCCLFKAFTHASGIEPAVVVESPSRFIEPLPAPVPENTDKGCLIEARANAPPRPLSV